MTVLVAEEALELRGQLLARGQGAAVGVDDATEVWWDPSVSGKDEIERDGQGLYQYVDGGKRFLPGEWPTGPTKAFQKDGAVSIYETVPPGEQVPTYPSPAGN